MLSIRFLILQTLILNKLLYTHTVTCMQLSKNDFNTHKKMEQIVSYKIIFRYNHQISQVYLSPHIWKCFFSSWNRSPFIPNHARKFLNVLLYDIIWNKYYTQNILEHLYIYNFMSLILTKFNENIYDKSIFSQLPFFFFFCCDWCISVAKLINT